MSHLATAPRGPSIVQAALEKNRVGVLGIVFLVLSAVAPLTVVAGVITTAYAVADLRYVPAAIITVALVLALFAAGFVAMAKRVSNSGAFYTYAAAGLGRPVGTGVAFMALAAYNLLQVGLYGIFGSFTRGFVIEHFGVTWAWWVWALIAWALVGALGRLSAELNGKALGVALSIEIAVIVLLTVLGIAKPTSAGGSLALDTLNPLHLVGANGVGALVVVAVLSFVGFELTVVYSEEAKDARRTVPLATYICLSIIATVYTAAAWAMGYSYGTANVGAVARENGPFMLFAMAGNDNISTVSQALFATSLVAAMQAFHNAATRYMFALGREGVLPRRLARKGARFGAPLSASTVQSAIGLGVISLYALMGWDPLVQLFFYLGTAGGFGVLCMIFITNLSVFGYFRRAKNRDITQPKDQPITMWQRLFAPALAAACLGIMIYFAVINYGALVNEPDPRAWAAWAFPAGYLALFLLGVGWGFILRSWSPKTYKRIGFGPNAVTGATIGAMA